MKKQLKNFSLKKQTISNFTVSNINGGAPTLLTADVRHACHPNNPQPGQPVPLSAGRACTVRTILGGCTKL